MSAKLENNWGLLLRGVAANGLQQKASKETVHAKNLQIVHVRAGLRTREQLCILAADFSG